MIDLIIKYLSTLGAAGLLVGVFIEALGLPFPGGIMIILAGVLCQQGKLNIFEASAAALLGYVLGSTTAYFFARNMGKRLLLQRASFLHFTPEIFQKAQALLNKSAGAFIVLGRFVPGIGNLAPYLAGLSNIGVGWFIFYNLIFVALWGIIFLTVGSFFDQNWFGLLDFLRTRLQFVAVGLLFAYLLYLATRRII